MTATGYGVGVRRVSRLRRSCATRSTTAIDADVPRLVEVAVGARACRCSDGGRRPARRGRARPRPGGAGDGYARAAALRPRRAARRRPGALACARPRPLRLRRQPVPPDSAGRRDGARRRPTSPRRSRYGAQHRHVRSTLRAGGTSLNGQGQSDGILVDVRRHFAGFRVLEDGAARAREAGHGARPRQPRRSSKHQRRLGPDPASTDIATVGGVIANNSGGMRCGVATTPTDPALADVRAARRARRSTPPRRTRPSASRASEPELADGPRGDPRRDPRRRRADASASGASSRSRTRPATGCARSSTPTSRWRSSAACWWARRARWASSPRRCSTPCPTGATPRTGLLFFDGIDAAAAPVPDLVEAGATAVELMVNPTLIAAVVLAAGHPRGVARAPARGGGAAGRAAHRRRGASSTGWSSAALAALEGHELLEPARLHARRARRSRCSGACARGCRGSSARCARRAPR